MSTSIYFYQLDELEYVKDGNRLPNLEAFIKKEFNEHSMSRLFEEWCAERGEHCERSSFEHELGTLLLNAKFYSKYSMFGMKYGCLAAVTYVNNSLPSLLEFYAIKA